MESLGTIAIVLSLAITNYTLFRILNILKNQQTPVPRQFDVAPSIFNQS